VGATYQVSFTKKNNVWECSVPSDYAAREQRVWESAAQTAHKLQLQMRANGHSNSGKSDPFCMAECSRPENSPRIQNLHDDRYRFL
jgi:hypothetical protein